MSMNPSGVGDGDDVLTPSLQGPFRKNGYVFKPSLE